MTIRTRILLVYLVIVGGGYVYLVQRSLGALGPRYLESVEASLVDTAHILASAAESLLDEEGRIDPARLRAAFDGAYRREFRAEIYSLMKDRVDLRVYVTDANGRVVYDSAGGQAEGENYAAWRDVARTLRGGYGARATWSEPRDEGSLVLYVGAPIQGATGAIVGVLSVGKPTDNINELVRVARQRLAWAGGAGGALVVVVGVLFSIWLTTPLQRLTAYARAVRDGRPATLPRLAGREVSELRQAFEEMRAALDGKAYVERYVQTLTHEIKSPLSAIRSAAELLAEQPPAADQARFVGHIRAEAGRIQRVVDQLLQLSVLEARKAVARPALCDVAGLVRELVDAHQPVAQARGVALAVGTADTAERDRTPRMANLPADERAAAAPTVYADRGLLGQALAHLVQNALDFTPAGGRVTVTATQETRGVVIRVADTGTGIPDFGLPRIFERFYSLPRPGGGAKSTGLGLSLVREIATLHEGQVQVGNRAEGGVLAELVLPPAPR